MKAFSFLIGIFFVAGVPLKSLTQTANTDTLRMQRYQASARKVIFSDRSGTLRWCDSMEHLAQYMDWPEKQIVAWSLRTESASVFANMEAMMRGVQKMDQLLPVYKHRLGDALYTRYLEDNYSFWGTLYNHKGNLKKGLDIFLHLEKSLTTKPQPEADIHRRLFALRQQIAGTYAAIGDYQKAIDYYLLSIENRPGFKKNTMHYVNALYQMGDIYRKQGRPEKAIGSYLLSLDSLNKAIRADGHEKWASYVVNLHRRLGRYYADQKMYNVAFEHFQTALSYSKPESPFLVNIHDNMGVAYQKINQPQKALEYLRLSMNLKRKMYGENSEKVAESLLFMGEVYQQQGNYITALAHCQKALGLLCNEPLDTNGYNNSRKDAGGRQPLYLTGLSQKAKVLYHLYRENPARTALLDATQETLQLARQQLDKMRAEYTAAADKQFLTDNSRPVYEMSIACELLRQRLAQPGQGNEEQQGDKNAFLLAEKTKSLLLYEGSQASQALQYSGIPDTLLQKEYDLRVDLAWYEQQRFELESKGIGLTDSAMLAINRRLFDLRYDIENLEKTFETNYPDYYRLKYDLHVEDVASVQRDLLEPNQALVSYFVGDSSVFIFLVRKTDLEVQEIKKDFPLEQWVEQLRTSMTAFHTNPDMAHHYDSLSALYTTVATKLYEKIIAPIAAKLPQKIIFIPDGVLGYVPYEALLVEKPENPARWNTHHYLLNDHHISYGYSAIMLREMRYRQHKQAPNYPFIGFAPAYTGDTTLLAGAFQYADDLRKHLRPLPYSGEEVYRAGNIMKGAIFVGPEATKARFITVAGKAKILHLATHGQANDRAGDYCFLVFADPSQPPGDLKWPRNAGATDVLLYAREIYNLQLNADLVTLSACETGIGELQNSEGIISLARAFVYAGAKSIVTSLWSVSDAKTKDLMVDFYKNIRKGMLKDGALRQAKLDFLKHNKGVAAHPFYWAGFVGIGVGAGVGTGMN